MSVIQKVLAGFQDLLFGQGTVTQDRNGTNYEINKINGDLIPYSGDSDDGDMVSLVEKIDELDDNQFSVDDIYDVLTSTATDKALSANQGKVLKDGQDLKAPLASPSLTGNPTAPTQSQGDNSTKLANTAYTDVAVAAASDPNNARNILENEKGVIQYKNGAIYKFDQWEDVNSLLTTTNCKPVPYKKSLSNVYTGFEVVKYNGDGTQGRLLDLSYGLGLTWIKRRSATDNHIITSLATAASQWASNLTAAQVYYDYFYQAYNPKAGCVLGSATTPNGLASTLVAWNWHYPMAAAWHANGGTAQEVPTPWGIVTSQESNASSGISGSQIVLELYNPLTGNGCLLYVGNVTNRVLDISGGIAPEFMIGKILSTTGNGLVYHSGYNEGTNPADYYTLISDIGGEVNDAAIWNDTEPTASLISLGTNATINGSGALQILYYFAPVAGLQAFGGYAGTGGAHDISSGCLDGMNCIKQRAGAAANTGWYCYDYLRGDSKDLQWELTSTESTMVTHTFHASNGFSLDGTEAALNASNGEYIYMHFGKEMVIQGDMVAYPATAITSTTSNDNVQVIFKYKGDATLNSELIVSASRNDGADWVALTAAQQSTWTDKDGDTWQLVKATGDISGHASTDEMLWKIHTDTYEEEVNIKDLDFSWSA